MNTKHFRFVLISILSFNTTMSQDIINPYLQYTSPGSNIFPEYKVDFQGGNTSSLLKYNYSSTTTFPITGYDYYCSIEFKNQTNEKCIIYSVGIRHNYIMQEEK